jgi:hypothetical protein
MKLRVPGGASMFAVSRMGAVLQSAQSRCDEWAFRRERNLYYRYLAALLAGTGGARTLKQIFAADARRYGLRSLRGRLSHRWLQRFETAGGDLYATWIGVFPPVELGLLRSAQARGNATLVATLGELSRVLTVLEKAKAILRSASATAVVAMVVWLLTLLAMPAFTVPRLKESFAIIPPEYHGPSARKLFALSDAVDHYALPCVLGGAIIAFLALWSFQHYAGRGRRCLDAFGPWRIYRQVQALQFLTVLAVALGKDEHGTTRLRHALMLQLPGSTPWLSVHLFAMVGRVDSGHQGAAIFDSGLLDDAQLWFLDDMISASGLVAGLRDCAAWVEAHVLGTVASQALALRWCLLMVAVAGVLGVGLWHYAAIDDLRRGLAIFHASQ